MEKVAPAIAYRRLKYVSDWRLVEENQRAALAGIVHGISRLDAAGHWGDGTTSASDGQRFAMPHKVLQQTYSSRFNDFALERPRASAPQPEFVRDFFGDHQADRAGVHDPLDGRPSDLASRPCPRSTNGDRCCHGMTLITPADPDPPGASHRAFAWTLPYRTVISPVLTSAWLQLPLKPVPFMAIAIIL